MQVTFVNELLFLIEYVHTSLQIQQHAKAPNNMRNTLIIRAEQAQVNQTCALIRPLRAPDKDGASTPASLQFLLF